MSLSLPERRDGALPWRRLAYALGALAAIALAFALLGLVLGGSAPPPPARNPFGAGLPREAPPALTGFGAQLLAWQSAFYRELTALLKAVAQSPAAIWGLLGAGFAYGVFHAAGPGHGKAVISGYIVADDRSLKRGLGLSVAAALLQALVAIAMVSVLTFAFRATAATMTSATRVIEQAGFAAIAAIGLWVLWRKAGTLAALGRPGAAAPACDHVHMPEPAELARLHGWREMAGVVFAAGLRPCAGALLLLVFAAAQGLFWAGIAAAFAMAAGTALTTGAIAAFAVFFKLAALRLAGGGGLGAARILGLVELLAAAFVAMLGIALGIGWWSAGAG